MARSSHLSEFTSHLEFEVKGVPRLGFVPGQWLSLKASTPDGEEITRAYSIASPPSEDARFAFCLNRVQDGFMSNYLCDMKEGDEITFQGPFGAFILRPPLRDTVFIATGTGIAPFRSMLHWLLADALRHQDRQFWLLFGVRYEQDIYYREEFERLAQEHSNFDFLPTLSREARVEGVARLCREHVPGIVGDHRQLLTFADSTRWSAPTAVAEVVGWDRKQILYRKYD